MDLLRKSLGLKPRQTQPPSNPTDEVFPVHFFDDTPLNRSVILHTTFVFNDVLDTARLHESLTELLNMDGWKKLGGRFRFNSHGKLEIHVPQQFDSQRPPVRFTETTFDVALDEHPLASQLPRPVHTGPFTQLGPTTFSSLVKPVNAPENVDDLINSDSPQLSLHVVKFTDGALVSLSWCHVTADIIGMSAIIKAWCLVLAGRRSEVPEDPMDTLERSKMSSEVQKNQGFLASHVLSILKMLYLVLFFFFIDPWRYGPAIEKTVYVPKAAVRKLRQYALPPSGTSIKGTTRMEKREPFASNGDIITAWFVALASSVLGPTSKRSVLLSSPFDIRGRLPSVFPGFLSNTAYVQNAVLNFFFIAPSREAVPAATDYTKLGNLALALRHAIVQQTTEAHVYALADSYRKAIARTGISPLFGEANSYPMMFSNWTKAHLFETVDFSPAVMNSSAADKRDKGRPSYVFAQPLVPGARMNRNGLCIIGTPSGDYWIQGSMTMESWARAEKGLEQLLTQDA